MEPGGGFAGVPPWSALIGQKGLELRLMGEVNGVLPPGPRDLQPAEAEGQGGDGAALVGLGVSPVSPGTDSSLLASLRGGGLAVQGFLPRRPAVGSDGLWWAGRRKSTLCPGGCASCCWAYAVDEAKRARHSSSEVSTGTSGALGPAGPTCGDSEVGEAAWSPNAS